ncbi:MAG: DUF222 domain-containing protein [Mycobacterium sp.]|nr:DUF222 domain-containing protein [Mycobacterium sp.]
MVAEGASVSGAGDRPGYLPGYGEIPAEMLRQLAARARLKPLTPPGVWRAESGYRPSAALDDFIRCRDVCCRFPGCDKPAEVCDIDHTVPWAPACQVFCVSRLSDFWSAVLSSSVYRYGSMRSG